ncbi:MAG: 16S rRNA (adenine(1518)-N(6)/adenine(1519)-N(6))-dimethyltransferase RsmA [Gammaproteobacteria bacterium]
MQRADTVAHTSSLPRPRKRFGQHFLHDPAVIDRIVAAIAPSIDKRILEIGPGRGALTRPLLAAAGHLDVVEVDRDLARLLPQQLNAGSDKLRVHCIDALEFKLDAVTTVDRPAIVVGNLPYNISSPLLFHLLAQTEFIAEMVFMLQKEVVERIAAKPGGKEYGRLSVMIQYHCRVEHLFNIGPGAFTPAPKVESAVVRLTPRQQSASGRARSESTLRELVRRAFTARRKTLRNALRDICTETMLISAGIDPNQRAETLLVEQFVRLANLKFEQQSQLM